MTTRTAQQKDRAIHGALEAARWAPSVHNTQPWSFAVSGEEISLRADVDRKLRVGDSAGRELLISCGAALFTIVTALRCEGFEPIVRVLPDPDRPSLVATVSLGAPAVPDEHTRSLGREIERRRTHRAGFTDLPVPDRLLDTLVREARAEGAKLTPVGSEEAVEIIAALTRAAQGAQSHDRVLNLEVIRWARPPGSARRDGVPAESYPRTAARTDPYFPQRDYAWRHEWGTEGGEGQGTATGAVALLTTRGDTREEWIAAGQALQRVLLHACAHGVSAAFHTQALEAYHLREFLRQELCSHEYPQMIMRLGITFDDKGGVRRSLPEMLD
ncbi:Acg family FMN-binding oxidoreductase [Nonomuraea lactucae]|uniref:Acg family FMN-binding oxidoreductase n=1 Tax=Nonomuraea lactucae TaxID=2249762 RepID=UPI000DE22B3C|nr:nitroreductase family protein [Nonomuraea lactucae]